MIIVDIIFLVLILISLNVNFKKDAGQHKKAKISHTIIVCLLYILFTGGFSDTYKNTGILPQEIANLNSYVNIITSIIMVIIIFSLIGRNKKAITHLKYIFPISVITQNINEYLNLLNEGGIENYHSIIFYSGFLFFAIPAYIIIKIYNKDFMKNYFNNDSNYND
jgi:hypothetical protein